MDTAGTTAAGRRIGALSAHVSEPATPLTAAPTTTATRPRLKIAAVVTEYRRYSHAQHICDRFLIGYGWENRHHKPECDLVALYVDQHDEATHLSDKRCAEFPIMKKYPTPEAAEVLAECRKELRTYIWETELQKAIRVEKEFEMLEQQFVCKQLSNDCCCIIFSQRLISIAVFGKHCFPSCGINNIYQITNLLKFIWIWRGR